MCFSACVFLVSLYTRYGLSLCVPRHGKRFKVPGSVAASLFLFIHISATFEPLANMDPLFIIRNINQNTNWEGGTLPTLP